MSRRAAVAWSCLLASAAGAGGAEEAPIGWELVATASMEPVGMVHAGDGSGRLFLVERPGVIEILDGGGVLPTPFLDITERVGAGGSEQGLLGLAFHPDYAGNGFFYVDYTDNQGDTVIARFSVSADPDVADPDSELALLGVDQPFSNHNGGQLAFGPDGYLYIALGDGGSGGDPFDNGQSLATLLGKILRIDVDADDFPGDPGRNYAIPPDNPFNGDPNALDEIWDYGLRNPWRFSFDRATGDLFIGDVGQSNIEEIDLESAGSGGGVNYGWNRMEGSDCFEPPVDCNDGSLTLPILEYTHAEGGCSVSGGYRYRGARNPLLDGVYIYGDYCTGNIWGATKTGGAWSANDPVNSPFRITSFGEDEPGEVYFAHQTAREIYRIFDTRPTATLRIDKLGDGTGTVSSAPPGIDCGEVCSAVFLERTAIELAAVPDYGSEFAGWSGAPDCADGALALDGDLTCEATFAPCSIESIVPLPPQDVEGTVNFEACNELLAGAGPGGFNVLDGADVTLRAGNRVVLQPGFSVERGGRLRIRIGPGGG